MVLGDLEQEVVRPAAESSLEIVMVNKTTETVAEEVGARKATIGIQADELEQPGDLATSRTIDDKASPVADWDEDAGCK